MPPHIPPFLDADLVIGPAQHHHFLNRLRQQIPLRVLDHQRIIHVLFQCNHRAAAKSAMSDATSLWSKAQGAFGNGNLDEAVSAAKDVKTKLDGLAATLKMDPPAAAAMPST